MLSVVRMGLSPIGKIIAATCTLPIVKLFGDDQAAWVKTMSIWAVLALILLLVCFFKCEETVRIEAKEKAAKVPLGKGFAALFKNQYFWAVLVLWLSLIHIYTDCGAGREFPPRPCGRQSLPGK